MGLDGFVWFLGVVEDRMDPYKLGRVRVRCIGFHSENLQDLPKEGLPWALVLQPSTSASVSGIGETPLGPVEGSWVFGFFQDGQSAQSPVVLGTFAGKPQFPADTKKGFNDPRGVYPLLDDEGAPISDITYLVNSDTTTTTYPTQVITDVVVHRKMNTTSVAVADGSAWNEPAPGWAAVYPYNHVRVTESGHVIELDDTPGKERIHEFHRSGTFREIYADGSRVTKVIAKDYELVMDDKNLYVGGDCNITVSGNANLIVDGNVTSKVAGNHNTTVEGNYSLTVDGTIAISAGGVTRINGAQVRLGE